MSDRVKKLPAPTEHQETAAVIEFCAIMGRMHGDFDKVFHIPNEGKRSLAAATYMKREGLKSGVPDLFWPLPRCGYHGLFIDETQRRRTREREAERLDRMAFISRLLRESVPRKRRGLRAAGRLLLREGKADMTKKKITFQLSEEDYGKMLEISRERNVSFGYIVKEAIAHEYEGLGIFKSYAENKAGAPGSAAEI